MGFRFSLETVLRLRRSLEDSERLRLQTLLAGRSQLQREIGKTTESRAAIDEKLKASLQQERLPGSEMQFAGQRLTACDLQTSRLHLSVATVTQQVERQQSLLLSRRIDRKVLEQLRERQLAHYEAEAQHRDQSQVEETFLLRRARGKLATSN